MSKYIVENESSKPDRKVLDCVTLIVASAKTSKKQENNSSTMLDKGGGVALYRRLGFRIESIINEKSVRFVAMDEDRDN